MSKRSSTKTKSQTSEALCVSELGRRGIHATSFAGNVPEFDVLARAGSNNLAIQVKCFTAGSYPLNASSFLNIRMEGKVQIVEGIKPFDESIVFFVVALSAKRGEDRIFILEMSDFVGLVDKQHRRWLAKVNGTRPRNPESTHCALPLEDFEPFEENWSLIFDRLGLVAA